MGVSVLVACVSDSVGVGGEVSVLVACVSVGVGVGGGVSVSIGVGGMCQCQYRSWCQCWSWWDIVGDELRGWRYSRRWRRLWW